MTIDYYSLAEALREHSVGAVASAIEAGQCHGFDRFGRFLLLDDTGKAIALDLVAGFRSEEEAWNAAHDTMDPDVMDYVDYLGLDAPSKLPFWDFGWPYDKLPKFSEAHGGWSGSSDSTSRAASPRTNATANPCEVFLAMENLDASELTITFVGDKSETGLGGNNLLEISARDETRRVTLGELGMVDRRRASINRQGGVLLGMANQEVLKHSGANAATMKRLREMFRTHLGLKTDPFEPYRKSDGWVPRFNLVDKWGAADERAKLEAERGMVAIDTVTERIDWSAPRARPGYSVDGGSDEADDWLKDNDPKEPA